MVSFPTCDVALHSMAPPLKDLLIEQTTVIESIKRAIINYKKLSKPQITLHKTQGRLTSPVASWEKCQALNVRLLQAASEEEQKTQSYFVHQEFLTAKDVYIEAADYLYDAIGRFTQVNPTASLITNESLIRELTGSLAISLPRISLPTFSGNWTEWENFRGIFESLVANNDSLTSTQKLHYLKASVIGEAALLINNIKVKSTNYESAWRLLVNEYDDQNAIIYAHINAFADLPYMKTENISELKKLRDTVASRTALMDLGHPVDMWENLLVYIISKKFSSKTREEWNMRRGSSDAYPSYQEIHEFMTNRIRGLTDPQQKAIEHSPSKPRENKQRTSAMNVSAVKCPKCAGNHYLSQCEEFVGRSVEERKQIAKQYKCCTNCLKPGHFPKACYSKKRCNPLVCSF